MEKGNSTFEIKQDASPRIFPIDFSLTELADFWGEDLRGIRDNLVSHPLLKSVLDDLIPESERGKKVFPLPAEIEPFLKCFYRTSKKPPFHTSLWEPEIPNDVVKRFLHQLCLDLIEEISQENADSNFDLTPFCRHVLFQTDSFNHEVMDALWDTQLSVRLNQLRELSRGLPFEKQAQILQSCILALDQNILKVIQDGTYEKNEHNDKENGTNQQCTEEEGLSVDFLAKNLLLMRNKSKNDLGQYELSNIAIPPIFRKKGVIKDLECAFAALKSNRNRKYKDSDNHIDPNCLLWSARRCYLDNLATRVKLSPFERQYFELQGYLRLTGSVLSEDVLKEKIENLMKKKCLPIIEYCCCPTDITEVQIQSQELLVNNYIDAFSGYVAQDVIDMHTQRFKDVYNAVNMNSELRSRYNNLVQMKDSVPIDVWNGVQKEICNGLREQFSSFMLWLNGMWEFLYKRRVCDPDQGTFSSYRTSDVELFTNGSKKAAAFFEQADLFAYSGTDIDRNLNLIINFATDPVSLTSPSQWLDAVYPFLVGAVLQVLERIINERTIELVPNLVALQQIWVAVDDGMSENETANVYNSVGQQD